MTKADGTRQPFDTRKVVRTSRRMGATKEIAEDIAEEIERSAYDGIKTKQILQMIARRLARYHPAAGLQICLRQALSLMKPRPDFERFVRVMLRENGYEVTENQVIRGRCVEHEVDAIARKSGTTFLVEVKHHSNHHALTGLDESRIARAILEDVNDGFKAGLNTLRVDRSMIVVNTKFSEHAKRYAQCRHIHLIGWSSPKRHNLQTMIEQKKLYPITCLKGLSAKAKEKLASAGVFLITQLAASSSKTLAKKAGLSTDALSTAIEKAQLIVHA